MSEDVWSEVVGQPAAVSLLTAAAADPVHAYLFVGPAGCTKLEAARAFAGLLLDPAGDPSGRDTRLARAGQHPDVREVHRVGPAISKEQAEEIVRLASLSPVEGRRKVLILDEFHLLRPEGAARLLKTVEEPPASTVFVILADDIPLDLVTIASRCVRVDFHALPEALIAEVLALEGATPEAAAAAARSAAGNLDRARLLADDPAVAGARDGCARRAALASATCSSLPDRAACPRRPAARPATATRSKAACGPQPMRRRPSPRC